MAKSKVRVHRLTLAPSSDAGDEGGSIPKEVGEDERQTLLEKEQMARMTDISIMSGERTHARPRVHGVEPTWRSKFWASGEDIDSSANSEDEEVE
jgi:hypothetical protein